MVVENWERHARDLSRAMLQPGPVDLDFAWRLAPIAGGAAARRTGTFGAWLCLRHLCVHCFGSLFRVVGIAIQVFEHDGIDLD